CLGLSIAFGDLPGQTVEIWRAQSQNAPENPSQFGTIAVIDSKDVLSLESDVVVANTTLLAQNEPLSPSEFNPDPGASQREQPETPEAPELFPPILPQTPEYGQEALPRSLQLPRKGVREVVPRRKKLEYETYPQSEEGEGLLPNSQPQPNSSEFFGRSDQQFWSNDFSIGIDLFKGETAFKPIDWALRLLGVYNHNYLDVEENNVVNPNPQKGTTREKEFWSLQEAFAEIHLRDLSNNYDFISLRVGMQPFVSDFRGF